MTGFRLLAAALLCIVLGFSLSFYQIPNTHIPKSDSLSDDSDTINPRRVTVHSFYMDETNAFSRLWVDSTEEEPPVLKEMP